MASLFQKAALILILVSSLFVVGLAEAQVRVPELRARVTDLTQTLSFDQQKTLESRLASFEQAKGSQVAVLIVPTTEPETIEQYAIRVAESWKLGRKGVDDGVLLLVAKNDRTLRIEVGYGLEGTIPDAAASRIINEIIVPEFKAGQFAQGIQNGVEAIIKLISGEPLPPSSSSSSGSKFRFSENGIFFAIMGAMFLGQVLGAKRAAGLSGIVGAGVAYFVLSNLLYALGAGLLIAIFVFVLNQTGRGVGRGRSRLGGWSSGGSSSSGGGFSGGGGSFGGGGASGRW